MNEHGIPLRHPLLEHRQFLSRRPVTPSPTWIRNGTFGGAAFARAHVAAGLAVRADWLTFEANECAHPQRLRTRTGNRPISRYGQMRDGRHPASRF